MKTQLGTLGTLFVALSTASAAFAQATPAPPAPPPVPSVGAPTWTSAQPAAPGVWIGVRLTPVPEPLEAQIGRGGLMIANVVADSPADVAGLERYDVVVSLNGKPMTDLDMLLETLSEIGAGNEATFVVLRGGQERTVVLRPAEGPQQGAMKFRYEEPWPEADDTFERYFGHRLFQDPAGAWALAPLGRLRSLPPDILNRLDDIGGPAWEEWLRDWRDVHTDPFRLHLRMHPMGPDKGGPSMFFQFDTGADEHADTEVFIRVRADGGALVVERLEDGTIRVERTDADGQTEIAEYGELSDLAREDPDAHRLLLRHWAFPGKSIFLAPPSPPDLPKLQEDWQARLHEQLARAEQARKRAIEQSQRALELSQKALQERMQRHSRHRSYSSTSSSDGASESVELVIENGRIELKITADGVTREYAFENAQQFREAEPELYERFRNLLETPDGANSEGARAYARSLA